MVNPQLHVLFKEKVNLEREKSNQLHTIPLQELHPMGKKHLGGSTWWNKMGYLREWEAQLGKRNSPVEDKWHNWHKPE